MWIEGGDAGLGNAGGLGWRAEVDEHRKHVHEIWSVFTTFAEERNGARFAALLPDPDGEPFAEWSHHDRYAARYHFGPDIVGAHRTAASRVCDMVERAVQDGLL